MTKKQTQELDRLLREACFARDGHACIRCHKTSTLSPSHIYPKGTYRKMRWDLDNVKTLCYRCHLQFWHKDPLGAWEWVKEALPASRLERLKLRSQVVDKTPLDFNLLKLYLKNEIKKYGTYTDLHEL